MREPLSGDEYFALIEKTAKKVDTWPAWKKGTDVEPAMRLELDEHRYSRQLQRAILHTVDSAASEVARLEANGKYVEGGKALDRRNEAVFELCKNAMEGAEAHINHLMKLHVDLLAVTLPKPIIIPMEGREGAD